MFLKDDEFKSNFVLIPKQYVTVSISKEMKQKAVFNICNDTANAMINLKRFM